MRQICLVARELAPVVDELHTVLGLEVCHRDPGVGKYGLENALFQIGHSFLEVVAPVREGTTAGRYLDRSAATVALLITSASTWPKPQARESVRFPHRNDMAIPISGAAAPPASGRSIALVLWQSVAHHSRAVTPRPGAVCCECSQGEPS